MKLPFLPVLYAGALLHAMAAQAAPFDPSPANIEAHTERVALAGGMKVALLPKSTQDGMVSMALRLHFGTEAGLHGKEQVAGAAAAMLLGGTQGMSRKDLEDAFDSLHAEVSVTGGRGEVGVSVSTIRANLPAALALLADALRRPAYRADELAACQPDGVAPRPTVDVGPLQQALDAARRQLHPGAGDETVAPVPLLDAAQVKAFHDAYYGADHADVAVVGDFDAAALKIQLTELFGDWTSSQPYAPIPDPAGHVVRARLAVQTPGEASRVLIGQLSVSLRDDEPDFSGLLIGNTILGDDFRDRLGKHASEHTGSAEIVLTTLAVLPRHDSGVWMALAIGAPQDTPRAEAALRQELGRVLSNGVTPAQLERAKAEWKRQAVAQLGHDGMLASKLSAYLAFERTLAYDEELAASVAGLTTARVDAVLRRTIKPAEMSIVSAGDFSKANADAHTD